MLTAGKQAELPGCYAMMEDALLGADRAVALRDAIDCGVDLETHAPAVAASNGARHFDAAQIRLPGLASQAKMGGSASGDVSRDGKPAPLPTCPDVGVAAGTHLTIRLRIRGARMDDRNVTE